jgi:hypothetical protein
MVEVQIQVLQNELNHLIDKGYNFSEVYDLSVELDKLILQYYNEKQSINL